ncbi:MAG: FAD-binding oxidoreductase [Fimbriimonadaceae bacterium]|nr:FAD-binding oxidoreductase [Fimbriimonadaceae bacterium]
MRSCDVVVVGGGIVGAMVAWFAAREGLRVVLVEPNAPGAGATATGMGHLVVMDDSDAQFALTQLSLDLWSELLPELDAGCEWTSSGTLWVARDDEEMGLVPAKATFYRERGVKADVLSAREVADAEPNLAPMAGGLRVPGDRVVYPTNVAARLIGLAQSRYGLQRLDGRVVALDGTATLEDGSRIEAGWIVNAAGANANDLSPGLPIKPRKGHLVITDRYPEFLRHQVVELGYLKSAHAMEQESVAFNAQPRATGQILLGSSRQFAGDRAIDRAMLARMVRRALEYLPGFARLSCLRTWVGLRAATPDKLPMIGPAAPGSRVLLATGHEGLGITTSTATGRLIADLIVGRASPIDPAPYLPHRFAEVAHG